MKDDSELLEKCLRETIHLADYIDDRKLTNKELYVVFCLFMSALNKSGNIPDGFEHEFPSHVQTYLNLMNQFEEEYE